VLSPIPRDTQSAHFGGSPIEKFPVVTLWRPLQQMSVETILYKFPNEKDIIILSHMIELYTIVLTSNCVHIARVLIVDRFTYLLTYKNGALL